MRALPFILITDKYFHSILLSMIWCNTIDIISGLSFVANMLESIIQWFNVRFWFAREIDIDFIAQTQNANANNYQKL